MLNLTEWNRFLKFSVLAIPCMYKTIWFYKMDWKEEKKDRCFTYFRSKYNVCGYRLKLCRADGVFLSLKWEIQTFNFPIQDVFKTHLLWSECSLHSSFVLLFTALHMCWRERWCLPHYGPPVFSSHITSSFKDNTFTSRSSKPKLQLAQSWQEEIPGDVLRGTKTLTFCFQDLSSFWRHFVMRELFGNQGRFDIILGNILCFKNHRWFSHINHQYLLIWHNLS